MWQQLFSLEILFPHKMKITKNSLKKRGKKNSSKWNAVFPGNSTLCPHFYAASDEQQTKRNCLYLIFLIDWLLS